MEWVLGDIKTKTPWVTLEGDLGIPTALSFDLLEDEIVGCRFWHSDAAAPEDSYKAEGPGGGAGGPTGEEIDASHYCAN